MTVSSEIENEIRVLFFGEHLPVGTVAEQLHVHEDVVRRVAGLDDPRPPLPPRPRCADSRRSRPVEAGRPGVMAWFHGGSVAMSPT